MGDKFLGTGGSGGINISDGSSILFGSTIGATNLSASRPLKTNSQKNLVSSNLEINEINGLQTALNNAISNPLTSDLDFQTFRALEQKATEYIKQASIPTPPAGRVALYVNSTDGMIHEVDEFGTDQTLTAGVQFSGTLPNDGEIVVYDGTTGDDIKAVGTLETNLFLADGSRSMTGNLDLGNNNIDNVQRISVNDGTAGSPSVHFDDPNSGFSYNSVTDQVQIGCVGTLRMTVNPTETKLFNNLNMNNNQINGVNSYFGFSGTEMRTDQNNFIEFLTAGTRRFSMTQTQVTADVQLAMNGNNISNAGTVNANVIDRFGVGTLAIGGTTQNKLDLSRAGIVTEVKGNLHITAGTPGAPSISFTADTTKGIYDSGANQLSIATAGVQRIAITNTDIIPLIRTRNVDGSNAAPAYSFNSNGGSGMYLTGGNIGFATASIARMSISSANVQFGTGGTEYTIPLTRGTNNQILRTNATGVATWQTPIFGQHYQYANSAGLATTTFVAYSQKLRMTTGVLTAGTYRVTWYCEIKNNDGAGGNIEVRLDDTTPPMGGTLIGTYHTDSSVDNGFQAHSGVYNQALTAATHTLDINYNAGGGLTSVQRARLEIFRVV